MHDLSYLHVMMKQVFRDVYVVKPESSRAMSAESFVIGIGFLPNANLSLMSESINVLHDKPAASTAAIEEAPREDEETKEEEEEDKLTF